MMFFTFQYQNVLTTRLIWYNFFGNVSTFRITATKSPTLLNRGHEYQILNKMKLLRFQTLAKIYVKYLEKLKQNTSYKRKRWLASWTFNVIKENEQNEHSKDVFPMNIILGYMTTSHFTARHLERSYHINDIKFILGLML